MPFLLQLLFEQPFHRYFNTDDTPSIFGFADFETSERELIENEALATMLQTRVTFNKTDRKNLNIENLPINSCIKSGDAYFVPDVRVLRVWKAFHAKYGNMNLTNFDPDHPAYILTPLKIPLFALPPLSLSTISTTMLLALLSKSAATLTSATRSRDISPALSVFSAETKSPPLGGSAFSPPHWVCVAGAGALKAKSI